MDGSQQEIEYLITQIKDHQICHGGLVKLVRLEDPHTVPARPIAVSIKPTPFPRAQYDKAVALQSCFNELYMRAGSDQAWLHTVFKPILKHDALLNSLWRIAMEVQRAGRVQDKSCGVFRSDYILHATTSKTEIKQVEMNTISVAGACHADRVARMHRHIQTTAKANQQSSELPQNSSRTAITRVLSNAHSLYHANTAHRTCVLMIVQPENFNITDERPIEYSLWDDDVACFRCEWHEVLNSTWLTTDRTLLFRPNESAGTEFEVSVVYYRAGHEAAEYDDHGMETRLHLELSRAIKCPDVCTHLTTFKVVQQALAKPGISELFLPSEMCDRIRETFVSMQVLDSSPAGLEATRQAIDADQASHYVLKPNLEGGGHNVFGKDIPEFLSAVPKAEWHKFILMRAMEPPSTEGLLLLPQEIYRGSVVSELGIIGACLWQQGDSGVEILQNEIAGWTFKTKPSHVQEMSVAKGFGCFDCPTLT